MQCFILYQCHLQVKPRGSSVQQRDSEGPGPRHSLSAPCGRSHRQRTQNRPAIDAAIPRHNCQGKGSSLILFSSLFRGKELSAQRRNSFISHFYINWDINLFIKTICKKEQISRIHKKTSQQMWVICGYSSYSWSPGQANIVRLPESRPDPSLP